LVLTALFVLAVSGASLGQKLWEKPPEKWSKDDVMNIVNSSPWAVTHLSTEGQARTSMTDIARGQRDTVNSGGSGASAGSRVRDAGPAPVVFRLHSGDPIRQAINRGRQIAAGYDKRNEAGKREFDQASKGFLECAICREYYVISATKATDSTGQQTEEGIFQNLTLPDLKANVWLVTDKGEKREIYQFTPPKRSGESAYMFFARKDEQGNVLISPENKSFSLVFNNGFFSAANPYAPFVPRSVAFTVSKITIGDKIAF
jgi:hypothetical protein